MLALDQNSKKEFVVLFLKQEWLCVDQDHVRPTQVRTEISAGNSLGVGKLMKLFVNAAKGIQSGGIQEGQDLQQNLRWQSSQKNDQQQSTKSNRSLRVF